MTSNAQPKQATGWNHHRLTDAFLDLDEDPGFMIRLDALERLLKNREFFVASNDELMDCASSAARTH